MQSLKEITGLVLGVLLLSTVSLGAVPDPGYRIYWCGWVGDGITPETAYRPSLAVNNVNGTTEGRLDYFDSVDDGDRSKKVLVRAYSEDWGKITIPADCEEIFEYKVDVSVNSGVGTSKVVEGLPEMVEAYETSTSKKYEDLVKQADPKVNSETK